jgi:hypothetical protein
MYKSFWNGIKIVRRLRGGDWVNTLDHAWIKFELYEHYKCMGYDPGVIKIEYEKHSKRH